MIDLVFAIRRLSPSDLKPSIKLANPELFDELQSYYHKGTDTISSTLIKELFLLAGDDWYSHLMDNIESTRQKTSVYRGQTMFESVAAPKMTKSSKQSKKKVYRGQVVVD